jgi:hypothetical protein
MNRILMPVLVVFSAFVFGGCAGTPPTADVPGYRNRAVTRIEGGVQVSTAVLSPEESAAVYGVPLADKKIQPVWIEVENHEDRNYFLLSPGLDPNFFPASEAAEAFAGTVSHDQEVKLDRRFGSLAFHNPVRPGEKASGFVLTNLNEGAKLVQIDLVARGRARTFSIFVVVPGFEADYKRSRVFKRAADPAASIVNYTDDTDFRAALEALPCCATNENGSKSDSRPGSDRRGRGIQPPARPTSSRGMSGNVLSASPQPPVTLAQKTFPVQTVTQRCNHRPYPVRSIIDPWDQSLIAQPNILTNIGERRFDLQPRHRPRRVPRGPSLTSETDRQPATRRPT